MKEVALSAMKDDLSRYLRQAAKQEIVITRHGKAAGVLIGFDSRLVRLPFGERPTLPGSHRDGASQPGCGAWRAARRPRARVSGQARRPASRPETANQTSGGRWPETMISSAAGRSESAIC